jgi:hypothetical protein
LLLLTRLHQGSVEGQVLEHLGQSLRRQVKIIPVPVDVEGVTRVIGRRLDARTLGANVETVANDVISGTCPKLLQKGLSTLLIRERDDSGPLHSSAQF